MNLELFIIMNYKSACNLQKQISIDSKMINTLRSENFEAKTAIRWMQEYGIVRGITNPERYAIAEGIAELTADEIFNNNNLDEEGLTAAFVRIFNILFEIKEQNWISASSKLLWCFFPKDIAMYDKYAWQSVIVLQGLLPSLFKFPRVGEPPKVKSKSDINRLTSYYSNYYNIVREILTQHQEHLNKVRSAHGETYPYDIRIIDKLLWMLGNPNQELNI